MRCGHYFLGDALSGAGLNATRTIIQIAVAATNVGLNLYFIGHFTWRGAAWTSILCDGLLVIAFAAALAIVQRLRGAGSLNDSVDRRTLQMHG
jgi:Na+-driven multidrug efflux pump